MLHNFTLSHEQQLTCADDGDAGNGLLLVDTRQLHVAWVVSNVHECGINHLVVNSVLGTSTHTSCSRVQVIDEQTAHLTLLDDVRRLPAGQSRSTSYARGGYQLQPASTTSMIKLLTGKT